MRWLLLLLFLVPGLAAAAASNVATTPRDSVSLVSDAPANGTVELALKFHLAPGWHIYWSNPGDAGLSPQITLAPPASAGPFAYPPPELLLQGQVAAYVLSGDVVLPFNATHVGNSIDAKAFWLVCSNICVPEHAQFALQLTGAREVFPPPQIVASPFAADIAPDGSLSIAGLTAAQVATARFFPATANAIVNRAPQPMRFSAAGMTLKLVLAPGYHAGQPISGLLELNDPSGARQALQLNAAPTAAARTGLAVWLAFAFLGGLILNLMPCVFPVLAMKAFAISRFGGAGIAHIRREALGYTAGVLSAMLTIGVILIGLRTAGGDYGWGFQFQSPIFVALIAWLILALGLNLTGLFEINIPAKLLRIHYRGSFFTGLLAVIIATPCTAPFMGGAIAAALTAPLPAALGIFLFLGLGLAAPFLLLAIFPDLASRLPRPGAWMIFLQRTLSIPMFATFLWLGWVMLREAGPTAVLLLALSALALTAALSLKPLRPAAALALLTLPFLHPTQAASSLSLPNSEPYTPARLAAYRQAGTPVFVDLTAAWCVTCLVNDHTTLTTETVQSAFQTRHIKTLIGDWTNRDPAITALLQSANRVGVPLYLYYPANAAPITLPQLLTPQIILSATN